LQAAGSKTKHPRLLADKIRNSKLFGVLAPAEQAARICKLREGKHVIDIKIASAEGKHWPSLLQVAWEKNKKRQIHNHHTLKSGVIL